MKRARSRLVFPCFVCNLLLPEMTMHSADGSLKRTYGRLWLARPVAWLTKASPWLAKASPWLVCSLIALGSLQPFLSGQVPLGADTALHFFRISAWDRLWSQGILYTQWLPDFALGYGYPLMNYHPPLAYYLGVVMHRIGLSLPHAM